MAGLYIHIPFCKTRCIYCDFFSSTDNGIKNHYIETLCKELCLRKDELNKEKLETIYWGGGTPSQLGQADFEKVFQTIDRLFDTSNLKEITIEANPDDLNDDYITMLRDFPFNRISIGIQSFNDNDLQFLNRRHSAKQAIEAVEKCKKQGFGNISIDLMYGLPNQSLSGWESNIDQAIALQTGHLSCYHLIYEEGTRLYKKLQNHEITECTEDISIRSFALLIEKLRNAGYEHYEISNFALPGYQSAHNTSYWKEIPYLGIGAAAHSYDKKTRRQNPPDLSSYIKNIDMGNVAYTEEVLNEDSRYNERILTSLRTQWGLDLTQLEADFGYGRKKYCMEQAAPYLTNKNLHIEEGFLKIAPEGIFISDRIMSDLLFVD